MKKCPNCGTKNADSALQCNFCDTKLDEEIKTESKSADYVHDEKTEKKRRLTGDILLNNINKMTLRYSKREIL